MWFVRLLEVCLIILFTVFIFTQVIIPAITRRKIFPMFNKDLQKVKDELHTAYDKRDASKLKSEVKSVNKYKE